MKDIFFLQILNVMFSCDKTEFVSIVVRGQKFWTGNNWKVLWLGEKVFFVTEFEEKFRALIQNVKSSTFWSLYRRLISNSIINSLWVLFFLFFFNHQTFTVYTKLTFPLCHYKLHNHCNSLCKTQLLNDIRFFFKGLNSRPESIVWKNLECRFSTFPRKKKKCEQKKFWKPSRVEIKDWQIKWNLCSLRY